MLEIMFIILAKTVWFVGSTQNVLYWFIKSINLLCTLSKLFTQEDIVL